ncbi:hypothetical protein AYI70_g2689 [Smittium culicis]|uniref:Uncharacterized protein n=1 Tax=Smittium culicis TaxID=133412 RepID=A0A1R1Y7S0_9FUNG|nr:hypothetical protein AYI70_g2689 [Smittium culicis]
MFQNEESINQEPVPSWAQEILFRLCNMESQAQNVTAPIYTSVPAPISDSIDISDNETSRDLYIVDRAPPRDFIAYPEILDSIPSIKNDFFRSSLTDAAKRKFIGLCPKNESMVNEPPSLNEFGLSSEAKKDDSKLFDIQYRLSEITRSIEYYVHTMLQRETNSLSAESVIEFSNAIRILFSDLSSHVTQLLMEKVFRNAKIPGKAPKILSASYNPLFDRKELVEHAASNKSMQKTIVLTRGANKRDYSVRRSLFLKHSSDRNYNQPQTGKIPNSSSLYGQNQLRQEGGSIFGNQNSGAVRSLSFGHRGRGENFRFKSEISESASASKILQNEESVNCMKACLSQRLDEKHISCRSIPSRTYFSIFKEISQFSMRKQKFSLPRSSIWLFLEPTSFHEGIAPSNRWARQHGIRISAYLDDLLILGSSKEQSLKNTQKLIQSTLENLKWWKESLISWNDRSFLPEVPEVEVFTGASDSDWETKQEPVSCSSQNIRAVVRRLSEFFDSPIAELRSFCTQSSRCSFKDEYTYGMFNTRQDIQKYRYVVRTARCGYVRSPGEPQTVDIFQLETISRGSSNERFQSLVEYLEEFILLPILESHHEDNPESPPREINLDTNNS